MREQTSKLVKGNGSSFGIGFSRGSTPTKKRTSQSQNRISPDGKEICDEEREESSTLIGGNGTDDTLIGNLDQSVKKLREVLDGANEKLDTVVSV